MKLLLWRSYMHISQLYTAFNRCLRWNAALYFSYKLLFMATSLLLFNRLSVQDYSIWANLNSFIFLALLWLDFGLRKSIPRYCPEFERTNSRRKFLLYVLSLQGAILIAAIPFFLCIVTLFFRSLSLTYNSLLLYFCATTFFVEGINASIKLFYHAHFWNKEYAQTQSIFLLLEMIINFNCIFFLKTNTTILLTIFASKLLTSGGTTIVSLIILKQRYTTTLFNKTTVPLQRKQLKQFVTHSGMMWFGNTIKSLSERNFLVPFITQVIDPTVANLFKVANDWAMLIYRPVIKTIGTSDTALLANLEINQNQSSITMPACSQLLKKVLLICLPFCVAIPAITFFITPSTLFLIISCGHIIETMLSPYERILEVKRDYKALLSAYLPYIIVFISVVYYLFLPSASLITALICIHTSRLTGSFMITYFAYTKYGSSIHIKPAIKKLGIPIYYKKSTYLKQKQKQA